MTILRYDSGMTLGQTLLTALLYGGPKITGRRLEYGRRISVGHHRWNKTTSAFPNQVGMHSGRNYWTRTSWYFAMNQREIAIISFWTAPHTSLKRMSVEPIGHIVGVIQRFPIAPEPNESPQ